MTWGIWLTLALIGVAVGHSLVTSWRKDRR